MFDRIADRYDLLNWILTLGRDEAWRRAALAMAEIPPGSRVGDVACGTGDFVSLLVGEGHTAVGIDMSTRMLAVARARLPEGHFAVGDALDLPFPTSSLDALTCGFALRNLTSISAFLAEAARVLRPGGVLVVAEVATPERAVFRFGHRIWFEHVVPRIGTLLSDRQAYAYLPASMVWLPPSEELCDLVRAHGFRDVRRRAFMLGAAQALVAWRTNEGPR
jgi:demethylmenaquinone methyltransferase/2-methoxy-6-polyprenyl-1,4-benzoquinol methylase